MLQHTGLRKHDATLSSKQPSKLRVSRKAFANQAVSKVLQIKAKLKRIWRNASRVYGYSAAQALSDDVAVKTF